MSRKEFIDSLREYLSYELPERLVSANIRKYEDYFDDQMKSGKRASEICRELGDPKLIARSCIDAARSGADGIPNSEDDPNFAEEIDRERAPGAGKEDTGDGVKQFGNTRIYTSRGCLIPILILIVFLALIVYFFVTGIGFWILIGILAVSAIVSLIRWFRNK